MGGEAGGWAEAISRSVLSGHRLRSRPGGLLGGGLRYRAVHSIRLSPELPAQSSGSRSGVPAGAEEARFQNHEPLVGPVSYIAQRLDATQVNAQGLARHCLKPPFSYRLSAEHNMGTGGLPVAI
ncbi:hypothetical protein PGTUg99_008595 [Puccinia graminis f. sp. tritici]|uniref:Uncharacterized protein n=1 Tax=Puccinia graminis f. sp. tritici TaxID=56615 RepID=A0A5B0MZN9_PUCGR|nr:hypothetical protein PGTUg99_008595 [Puccinia graminis f. sp. tritici]